MDGEVLIVDEHTGRMLAGRRYNDGLHQAIEAKEGVDGPRGVPDPRHDHPAELLPPLRQALRHDRHGHDRGLASSTRSTSSASCRSRPTSRWRASTSADLVYRTEEAKYDAVVDDIAERHAKGQPMLVGTVSVEKSEHLSDKLLKRGIPHTVLNAKQHADEAKVVALAGHKGAVTVATNMAGRGTDIMLGGSVDFLADQELRKQGLDPIGETAEEYEAAWPTMVEKIKAQVAAEHDEVTRARRPLRRRHRAPRVAPHRQPAARSFRPSGRPGRVPVLPVARGRADAAVQVRLGRPGPARSSRSPTTSRSRTSASPTPSPAPRARSSRRTSSPARTSSSTTT